MGNRLYVGNLSYKTSDQELRSEFEKCGTVTDARIVTDRETGNSRGFGFVQFSTDAEANAAIQALDGQMLGGRTLTVKIAEQRQGGRPGGGGGGGGGSRFNGPPPQQSGGYDDKGGGRGGGGGRGKRRRDRDDAWD